MKVQVRLRYWKSFATRAKRFTRCVEFDVVGSVKISVLEPLWSDIIGPNQATLWQCTGMDSPRAEAPAELGGQHGIRSDFHRRPGLCRGPGKQADLALFKLDEPRFSGAGDPLAALVLCGAHRADRVMIGGAWRVADGEIADLDLGSLMARHREAARSLALAT